MPSPFQIVKQNKWLRGLNAAASIFSQPEGIVKAVSNLIFTRRGALRTCDGSKVLSSLNAGGPTTGQGLFLAISPFQPPPTNFGTITPFYIALQQYASNISAPVIATITAAGSSGSLGSGTYHYKVTSFDYNGETIASNEVAVTTTQSNETSTVTLSGGSPTNAYLYGVYRTAVNSAAGSEGFLLSVPAQPNITSFTDDAPDSAINFARTPPITNATQQIAVIQITSSSYSAANIIAVLPSTASNPSPCSSSIGSYGGSWTGGNVPLNPAGGIAGVSEQIPQIVPFLNQLILTMGNGVPPHACNGFSVVPIINSFNGSWPAWAASTVFSLGTILAVSATDGNTYLVTAIQGGESAATHPVWPIVRSQQVADGSIIWQNSGIATIEAPVGAAHAIVYSGSLWLWNTWPTDTPDGLNGPSCLKMSDADDVNSWNPLNTAFVNKSDGTQGMGMATFTVAEAGISPQGTLVLFKDYSTYQVTGVFGASDFSIQQAQTDMGCVAPRTILFIPGFGIVRLTHLGFAIYDGVRDRLISEEIRPYLFPDSSGLLDPLIVPLDWSFVHLSKAWQTANPPMYCAVIPLGGVGAAGYPVRLCCYDLVLKIWTIIDLPWPVFAGVQSRIEGTIPISIVCGATDGTIRRIFAGDATWDGTAVSWSVKTPEVFTDAGATRLYVRRIKIRGTASDPLSFSVTLDQQSFVNNPPVIPVYWSGLSAGFSAQAFEAIAAGGNSTIIVTNASAIISGSGRIQIEAVDWEVAPKPSGMSVPTLVEPPISA